MGTRADFYIGTGSEAEWLGSVAWDGYEWDDEDSLLTRVTTPDEMRAAVRQIAANREDFTSPDMGWPWPWNTSHTTDYAYALVGNNVLRSVFGTAFRPLGLEDEDGRDDQSADFPDMSARKNVTFGKRSGVLIFGA